MKVETEIQRRLRGFLKAGKQDRRKPKGSSLNPRQVAQKGPLFDTYLLYSQLSSDSAHPTITALNRHFKPGGRPRRFLFTPVPTDDEVVDTMTWTCCNMLGVCLALRQLLGSPALNKEAAELAEEYGRLANIT
jgi:hypothetical protein